MSALLLQSFSVLVVEWVTRCLDTPSGIQLSPGQMLFGEYC